MDLLPLVHCVHVRMHACIAKQCPACLQGIFPPRLGLKAAPGTVPSHPPAHLPGSAPLQGGGSLGRRLQDVVVLVLLCALGFGVANLAFKLLIVMWALIAAALRYTILGIILLVVLALWT